MLDNRTHNGPQGIPITLGGEADGAEYELEGTWNMERDMISCDSIYPEPDPRWTFTDQAGHEHRWVEGGKEEGQHKGSLLLPTLEYVITGESGYDDGCGQVDVIEEGEWRCRECGEVVLPGTRTTEPGRMEAGPVRWSSEVSMSAKQLVVMPRSWLDQPIAVSTPFGRGQAYITEVVPGDFLGCLYEVKLRGVGGLTMEGEEGGSD